MYKGFPRGFLDFVTCQADGSELRASTADPADFILRGAATCVHCGACYPIEAGILDLTGTGGPVHPVSAQERSARDRPLARERSAALRRAQDVLDRLEIPSTVASLEPYAGKDIIDFGCGWGRITLRLLDQASRVLAIDFSRGLLTTLASRIEGRDNVALVLADATRVRLSPDSCDRALSSQVLEHLPGANLRLAYYQAILRPLRSEGIFVCTAYAHSLSRRIRRLPQDGFHDNGIYYHYFTRREIDRDIGRAFKILAIRPIRVEFPFVDRFGLSTAWLSSRSERIPLLNSFGRLLLVLALKA